MIEPVNMWERDHEAAERARAAERRDAGIERSSSHAERVTPLWNEMAYTHLRVWLLTRDRGDFLAEDAFKEFQIAPPDGRAYGAVMRKAAAAGIIHKIGYAPAKSSNLSVKVLWRKS